jgi:hypothetical protein
MMEERGVEVDHSTLYRWVLKYTPQLAQRPRSRRRFLSVMPACQFRRASLTQPAIKATSSGGSRQ